MSHRELQEKRKDYLEFLEKENPGIERFYRTKKIVLLLLYFIMIAVRTMILAVYTSDNKISGWGFVIDLLFIAVIYGVVVFLVWRLSWPSTLLLLLFSIYIWIDLSSVMQFFNLLPVILKAIMIAEALYFIAQLLISFWLLLSKKNRKFANLISEMNYNLNRMAKEKRQNRIYR